MYKGIFNLRTHNPQSDPSPGQHERKQLVHWFWVIRSHWVLQMTLSWESPIPKVSDHFMKPSLYEIQHIAVSIFEERRPWDGDWESYLQGSESSRTTE